MIGRMGSTTPIPRNATNVANAVASTVDFETSPLTERS